MPIPVRCATLGVRLTGRVVRDTVPTQNQAMTQH
jgi:hypothetical protein